MSETPDIDTSLARKAKDTAAGFVGGAVQVLVGQPFDLVKVRLQTSNEYGNSPWAVAKNTLKSEGPLAFYKGTLAPLFGVGACVSIQFYAFHEAKRQLQRYYREDLTLPRFYVAGAAAGIANTVITSPVEQLRILLQTQRNNANANATSTATSTATGTATSTATSKAPINASAKQPLIPESSKTVYHGPVDAFKKISAQNGFFRGIYRGFGVTLLREAQAYGVWFATYEWLMRTQTSKGLSRGDIPTWKLMLFGALAGEALWIASYPLDVVKSQVQSDSFVKPRYSGAIDAFKQTYSAKGFAGLWRGIIPTLLRAIPASSCTFASVELTLRLLG